MRALLVCVAALLAGFGLHRLVQQETRVISTVKVQTMIPGAPVPTTITLELRPHGIITWKP